MTAGAFQTAELPSGLRERVLAAGLRARPAGRAVPHVVPASPVEAFSGAADAFYRLLCGLDDEAWRVIVLRGLDTRGLVGHLIGVEEHIQRALSGDQNVAGAGHVEDTQPAAERQAGRPAAAIRDEWRHAVDRTLSQVGAIGDLSREVAVYRVRLPLGAILIGRSFELWAHDNDIRLAAGLPPSLPDTPTLRAMCELAVLLLPFSAAGIGAATPVSLRLVLTGPGGGTWDVAIGQHAGSAVSLHIVTDAAGFCRLAANRVTPAELDPYVTGDPDLASRVLAATASLALD